jgi:large subunit ribosomal protein L10
VNKEQKAELLVQLKEKFTKANAAFVSEYRGMTVEAMTELRRKIHASEGELKVIQNRIAKLATKGTSFENIATDLKGPLAVAFSYKDPVGVAKAVLEHVKEESPFQIKFGSLSGKKLSAAEVKALSKLPDRQTLLATFAGTLAAPLRNFMGVISAVPRNYVNVLVAVKDQKEKA